MITEEYFLTEIKKLSELSNQRIQKSTAGLLYHELKDSNFYDFDKAMVTLKYSEKRLTLASLHNAIGMAMSERLEKERNIKRKEEQSQMALFWKENQQHISQGHCNRKCIKCPVKYCKTIQSHSIQAMKDIVNGDKTLDKVNGEMGKKFEGWNSGFGVEPF